MASQMEMRRMRVGVWVAAVCAMSLCAAAQTRSAPKSGAALPMSFEVVSIRPVPPDSQGTISLPAGTEFRAHAMQLSVLVQMAFGINPNQMVIPEWAQGVKFDIAAKTGSETPLTYEQMKPLMQKMLAERFQMTYHRETREVQGFEMVAAKGGLKLTPAKPGSPKGGGGGPGAIDLPNTTMNSLAGMLTAMLKRPVADRTGATGDYEVKLRFAPEEDAESTLPSIFTAVQEDLGVKLESAKVPVEMVVIDHLEKAPTEN
jgi:uncharacterized protein (TIGR03435 family)